MRHHAYFYAGDIEDGVAAARTFGEALGFSGSDNPDIIVLRYGLFSVEDARAVATIAGQTARTATGKLVVVGASRIFHEAQNALLKTFEEPPPGTTLVLVVPSEGNIIPTLRSRLLPLPAGETVTGISPEAKTFLSGTEEEREKIVAKILDRAKSDKVEEKQAARIEALGLAEGLTRAVHKKRGAKEDEELTSFLSDLSRLVPILHERSAPLKPILEHLLIVAPT